MDKNKNLWKLGEKCNGMVILLSAFLIWGSAQILNMPVITTYRFGIYMVAFLLGYFVISHDNVQAMLAKMCLPMLVVSVFMGAAYTIYYFGENYADAAVLKSLFTNIYAWFMTLAVLGCGRKWLDRQNAFCLYMTKAGYGLYVLHYTFVLIPCYYLKNNMALPVWVIYSIALLIVLTGTPVLYELISRLPVARYFILGQHDGGHKRKADERI